MRLYGRLEKTLNMDTASKEIIVEDLTYRKDAV